MKWVAIALLASTPAYAESFTGAISRRADGDIARLRAKLPDESARCALGVIYLFRDDLTRAARHLEGCGTAQIAPQVAGWARLAVQRLDERLRLSELAALEVTTRPAGLMVSIDTVPGELFATPGRIWLPAGTHAIRAAGASVSVTLRARAAATAQLVVERLEQANVDPRVAVMHANDCAMFAQHNGGRSCRMVYLDEEEDFDIWIRLQHRRMQARRYDPRAMILQAAEEL